MGTSWVCRVLTPIKKPYCSEHNFHMKPTRTNKLCTWVYCLACPVCILFDMIWNLGCVVLYTVVLTVFEHTVCIVYLLYVYHSIGAGSGSAGVGHRTGSHTPGVRDRERVCPGRVCGGDLPQTSQSRGEDHRPTHRTTMCQKQHCEWHYQMWISVWASMEFQSLSWRLWTWARSELCQSNLLTERQTNRKSCLSDRKVAGSRPVVMLNTEWHINTVQYLNINVW